MEEIEKDLIQTPIQQKSKRKSGGLSTKDHGVVDTIVPVGRGTSELTPEENKRFIAQTLTLIDLEPVNWQSAVNIRNRVKLYFRLCAEQDTRPILAGLLLALGIDEPTYNSYVSGKVGTAAITKVFKEADTMLQHQMGTWMAAGRIAPVSGIFALKSFHGRSEEQIFDSKPTEQAEQQTREELERKYEGIDLSYNPDIESVGIDDMDIIDAPQKASERLSEHAKAKEKAEHAEEQKSRQK